ncbi:MAG: UDP-glucose 4-epimerase, partial [Chloroflexota bacterium]
AELTGYNQPPTYAPALSGEVYRIYLTNERARQELGWEPTVDLHEGLRLTVEDIRAKLAAKAAEAADAEEGVS